MSRIVASDLLFSSCTASSSALRSNSSRFCASIVTRNRPYWMSAPVLFSAATPSISTRASSSVSDSAFRSASMVSVEPAL
jgi:hypothetical protein